MAMVNPERVRSDVIEANDFPDLARAYQVRAVPRIVINDRVAFDGALPEQMFLTQVERALGKAQGAATEPQP